jgi:L-iditol 2-dehydrogenase
MRTVPLVAPRQLELVEQKLPDGPRPGEVLVKLKAVGLCGSDLHWWNEGNIHGTPAQYPQILGHEPVGEVVETGPGVHGIHPGDRVSIEPSLTCGHCEYCLSGRHNLCLSSRFMGGPQAAGFLQDYRVVPAHNCDPIPDGLTWHQATLMEPVAVWVHIFELAPVHMHQTVAVLGCGSIGLLGIAMAKAAGARSILACDKSPHRLEMARKMGANVALEAGKGDFLDAVMQTTRGHGADLVYDAAGTPETINSASSAPNPVAASSSSASPNPSTSKWTSTLAMAKELHLQMIKRSNHKGRAAGALLASGQIPSSIITHSLPLSAAQHGFDLLHQRADGVGKLIFDMDL